MAATTTSTKAGGNGTTSLLANPNVLPNEATMGAAAEKLFKKKLPKGSVGERVAWLRDRYAQRYQEMTEDEKTGHLADEHFLKCDRCGETATDETDHCPFCGDLGTVVAAGAATGASIERSREAALDAAGVDLDKRVGRIKELRRDILGNAWEIGVELAAVFDGELWKARGFESWKDFLQKGVGLGKNLGYELVEVVKKFSKDQWIEHGQTKLALIASAPESARPQLLGEAATTPTRALEKRVQEEKARAVSRGEAPGRTGKSAPGAPQAAARAPAKPAAKPTLASAAGKAGRPKLDVQQITLLAKVDGKPFTQPFLSGRSGKPIQKYDEGAYCRVKLATNVVMDLAPKFDRKGAFLGITVQFKRAE